MKFLTGLATVAFALSLAACGDKEGGDASSPAGPVAAVAAPAGTTWADTVATTPEGGFVMGNPDAKVKVTEFASYTCSHCAEFSAKSSDEIRNLVNSGKMSYELRNYVRDPLDMTMSLLARCGGAGPFFPLSEQFFANQAAMFEKVQAWGDAPYQAAMAAPPEQRFNILANGTGLTEFAMQRGIAQDQAKQCLANTTEAEKLAKGVQEATTKYNITGTPTLLINGTVVENAATWEVLREKLKEAGV
ncbi:protein-disulfide isomerase [Sphingobium sp. SCG-1]|uniref:thioredoxin domain-containing protein n=1 Tax=Sphingobium sp. SCG-1 TaxID=2072936 RepID=UPI000CD695FA|nr:thioredoxin domain-containing protein [Sphingobium sp. SCG-1]AUW57600.1 protein-disulfide isomerase [Sphingobium sp. SCG-1]